MQRDPWVIGRTLDREIERDFEAMVGAGSDQATEIVERAKLGMHRVMSALARSDSIGAAGITGFRLQRIVAPFAIGAADGMDRSEVQHIEAERGDLRQSINTVREC